MVLFLLLDLLSTLMGSVVQDFSPEHGLLLRKMNASLPRTSYSFSARTFGADVSQEDTIMYFKSLRDVPPAQ